ncbi:arsenate reductase/protein-tyrosine-phosphatase family protein [Rothia nasimurium]|uniref:arsenate reductase/protein-tyrosine-phosphatase family protein n=1 Tax=Rothia nasimurium TaxID=85336 RepID=UPI001F48A36C|nr:hypothetical protein [Rothia nasimurium]
MSQFNVGAILRGRMNSPIEVSQFPHPTQKKILFVCTGNIARSASAQYLSDQLASTESDWVFDSAGTGAVVGAGVAPHIDTELESRGAEFENHKAKQITGDLLAESALVLVMEKEHLNWIVREWPQYRPKVHLLKQMARVKDTAGRRVDPIAFMYELGEAPIAGDRIADPYRKGAEAARVAVEEVELALTKIIPWLGA